jgi:hypothetical protein
MLDQERPRITLLWVPSHKRIPGNENSNLAAKKALEEDILTTERYPPDDLKKSSTEEDYKKWDQRWKNRNNENKERKPLTERRIQKECQGKSKWKFPDSEPGIRGPPTASSLSRVGYPLCRFFNTDPSVHHKLWGCKKIEEQRMNIDMKKNNGSTGKKVWKRWKTTQKKLDCTAEYRNEEKNIKFSF